MSDKEKLLYWIQVDNDGTWLILNGPNKKAMIRLESLRFGPIISSAIDDIRKELNK